MGDRHARHTVSSCFSDDGVAASPMARITRHPLYPIVRRTQIVLSTTPLDGEGARVRANLDAELYELLRRCDRTGTPLLGVDPEVDNLMLDALYLLRSHVAELDGILNVCEDFCRKYSDALRNRLQMSTVFPQVQGDNDNDDDSAEDYDDDFTHKKRSSTGSLSTIGGSPSPPRVSRQASGLLQPDGVEVLRTMPPPPVADGSVSVRVEGPSLPGGAAPGSPPGDAGDRKKRAHLPAAAVATLKHWLFNHVSYPYPSEDDKASLATSTSLTVLQVNNWFINARRRILQPLLAQIAPGQGMPNGAPPMIPGQDLPNFK